MMLLLCNCLKKEAKEGQYSFMVVKNQALPLLNKTKCCSFYGCFIQKRRTKINKFVTGSGKIVVEKD